MADPSHSFTSNNAEKLLREFLAHYLVNTVALETVDKSTIDGEYDPSTGATVSVKRPHLGKTSETSAGDLSSEDPTDILSGKVTGDVQNMITVWTSWTSYEEALNFDQKDDILKQLAKKAIVRLEQRLQEYIIKNGGLCYGDPGTVISTWSHVAGAGAMLQSLGADDENYFLMNPFVSANLADAQTGLSGDGKVDTAWQKAQISRPLAGMQAIMTKIPVTYTSMTGTDRAGELNASPDVTYATAKDTMRQDLNVTGLAGGTSLKAGDVIEFDNRYIQNPNTEQIVTDETGAAVKWRTTVRADETLTAGANTAVTCTSAGIYESGGQYNNMPAALASGDTFTVLGSSGATYQPGLFYNKQAFGCAFVDLPLLPSLEGSTVNMDGVSMRVTKYADGTKSRSYIRFDILPVFACFNPLWGGKAFGKA